MTLNLKAVIFGLIATIIVFVVIFLIVGNTSDDITDAADSITTANNCSEGVDTTGTKLIYNISDAYCRNSTGNSLYLAGQYDLPLNTLFSSSGVVLMVFMAFLLILLAGIGFKFFKKK